MATCEINKIDTNITGLRFAEEECPGQLPAVPVWYPTEPNSYSDFGPTITTVARAPINPDRSRTKGGMVDLDAVAGFNMDLTDNNLDRLMSGFMFADIRTKPAYSAVADADDITVVITPGQFPALHSTELDFTTLGLIPGEWVYIGGDTAGSMFPEVENNGFKRVYSITAGVLTFDKSVAPMVASTGVGVSLEIFMGRVLRNERASLIKRKTFQLERTLGSLDGLDPPQSEYVIGAAPNQFALNITTADKITTDLTFVALDGETRTQAEGLKAGTRPQLIPGDMFNSSSDVRRVKLSYYSGSDVAPTPMFAFMQDMTLNIDNGITPAKAIGKVGAFDTSAGDFTVSGSLTAYFSDVAAIRAVRNNADVTLDMILVNNKGGLVFDMPLLTLGDGRPNLVKDQPITLPLSLDANSGASINPALTHTLLLVFFDDLPEAAKTVV